MTPSPLSELVFWQQLNLVNGILITDHQYKTCSKRISKCFGCIQSAVSKTPKFQSVYPSLHCELLNMCSKPADVDNHTDYLRVFRISVTRHTGVLHSGLACMMISIC